MSRATGYFGLTNYLGSRFLASDAAYQSFAAALRGRGLAFVDDGSASLRREGGVARVADGRLGIERVGVSMDFIEDVVLLWPKVSLAAARAANLINVLRLYMVGHDSIRHPDNAQTPQTCVSTSLIEPPITASAMLSKGVGWAFMITTRAPFSFAPGLHIIGI